MSTSAAIGIALLLLVGNAFFVGAEFALISARRSTIEPLAEAGNRRARATLGAMERVSLMMAGAQLGITVCSLGIGALAEPAVASLIEPPLSSLGLPSGAAHAIAFVVALGIVVYLHMVVGEMVPKNIALAGPERAAMLLGPPHAIMVKILFPIIWLFNGIANLVLRALRVQPKDEIESAFTSEQVARLVEESRSAGLLDPEDHLLLTSALELTEKHATEVAVPVAEVVCVPQDATPRQIQARTADTGFSRLPLQAPDGSLIGYTHVKDTLDLPLDEPLPVMARRELPRGAAEILLTDAIGFLRQSGSHLGIAVDSSGRDVGVLFLEDALEELIGEVRDAAHRTTRQ
jgi:CBS domain containing-hemolysin-like protein